MENINFEKEIGQIYRLKVPFMSVYTSVFLIMQNNGNILVDCATYDSDVDNYIIPALRKIGLNLDDITYLVLTHNHEDHVGGKNRILKLAQNIKIIQSPQKFMDDKIIIYPLKGHTLDCIGVFDTQSKTLISSDGLQGAGIGKFRCSLQSKEEYLKTIDTINNDSQIQNILFSHAYEPWYKNSAFGRDEIKICLQDCKKFIY